MRAGVDRLSENEIAFRAANERISKTVKRLGINQPVPMICECGRTACTSVIRVLPSDYERVRAVPNRFLYAPGHVERISGSRAVEVLESAVIVQKLGESSRLAEDTDPRGAQPPPTAL